MISVDTAQWRHTAAALATADKAIKRETIRSLRTAATPLADRIVAKGADPMPRRGGLRERLAAARATVRVGAAGSNPAVAITLRTQQGDALRSINASGTVGHPVFGNRKRWRTTRVPSGTWTRAFAEGKPLVVAEMSRGMNRALRQITGQA